MGVFARLLRRSKTTEGASAAEARAAAPAAAGVDADEAEEASGTAKKPASADTGTVTGAPVKESGTDAAADGVGIPRQQSAEEAADNEAGEGARK
ncbi:hypothetical protein [Streptomyces sp. NPDC093094]|uniref:hypothetical protein n=1 Tax=Streptomyces sp. NPDC093094 TaxID=3366026 RepID=UPI003826B850